METMKDTEPTVYVFTAGNPNEGLTLQGVYTDPAVAIEAVRKYAAESIWDDVELMGYAPGKGGEMEETGWVAWGNGSRGVQTAEESAA
jgi:hypothetical protein